MKNLLIILAIILPLAISAQSTTPIETPVKKNTITASLGTTGGLALDYRRGFNKNREFIIGISSTYIGSSNLNVGFRKYYNTHKKLSLGFGLDAGLKKRNIIGDNLFSRTIENTFLKVNYGQLNFVGGAYYKIDDRFDLMGEFQLTPFWSHRSNNLKVGLKYRF